MTEEGRRTLIDVEGVRLSIYPDAAGAPTIGVGHLLTEEEMASKKYSDGITRDDALRLMDADVAVAASAVKRLVRVPLNEHQLDALTIFVFNVGADALARSTLLRKLNGGIPGSVPDELRKWVMSSGKKLDGRVHRREAEIRLWNMPAESQGDGGGDMV